MHQKVFGKVTTKKRKTAVNEKRRLATILIDFLFFIPHENKSVYVSETKRTDPRIGSR